MGIRNKVGSTGWVSEKITGTTTELDTNNTKQTRAPVLGITTAPSGSVTAITAPVGMLSAGVLHTTASLPAITADLVGKSFLVFGSGSNTTLITSSNTINGGAWTRNMNTNFSVTTFIAYSSSLNGYGWVASSGSAI